MNNGNRKNSVLPVHRLDAVDEGAHGLLACREDADHPTVEGRYDRLYPPFQGIKRQIDDMFAALVKIRVGKFEERSENIDIFDAFRCQVAMRVELACDQNIRSDNGPYAFQKIALAIVITLRDHRPVQAQYNGVDRHRCLQLIEDFVAQFLIGLPLQQSSRLGPGGGSFDDSQFFRSRALAQGHDGRRAKRRRFRVFARCCIKAISKETRSVGTGEKVFVSVANDAVKIRMEMACGNGCLFQRCVGDGFDFDLDVDHQSGFDGRTRWRLLGKIGGVDGIHAAEITRILQPDSRLDDVVDTGSGQCQCGLDVFEYLSRLGFDAAVDDAAVRTDRHLTRNINGISCANSGERGT